MDYTNFLSQRVMQITPSATLEINALAKEYLRQGKPVLSFATGEPDFSTPPAVTAAAVEALKQGKTKYTATPGIPELREAVAERYRERYGVTYEPGETVITVGGKQALYNLFQTILESGDEVVMMSPYWVSYPEMIKLAGGRPIIVSTELDDGFVPDLERIKTVLSHQTKAILINSPNNPTGAVYPRKFLEELVTLAAEHNLLIISDEIYEDLVYQGEHTCTAALSGARERTVVISGVSKSYSMTGWRLGWAVGPEVLIKAMVTLQSHSTSNATSVAQYAALAALTHEVPEVAQMRQAFARRRELMYSMLKEVPGLKVALPQGAFYLFVDIRGVEGISSSQEFCRRLLSESYVATVPGEAFGAPGHMRLSYAASEQDIAEGCRRIAEFVRRMTG
ncbi:MAG: pyridoxal phosphate-dependent aminotransferase [Firmicutes bacterium]|nr:pyridoxal phosphate-dependent aminotransferase [Bacillota bacterium]